MYFVRQKRKMICLLSLFKTTEGAFRTQPEKKITLVLSSLFSNWSLSVLEAVFIPSQAGFTGRRLSLAILKIGGCYQ